MRNNSGDFKFQLFTNILKFIIRKKINSIIQKHKTEFSCLNIELLLNKGIHNEMIKESKNSQFSSKTNNPADEYFYTIFLEDLGKLFFNSINKKKFSEIFRVYKFIRETTGVINTMEDLVKMRLEEAFGELFVEGLEEEQKKQHQNIMIHQIWNKDLIKGNIILI